MDKRLKTFQCITLLLFSPFVLIVPLPPCPRSGSDQHIARYRDYIIRAVRTDLSGCLEVRKAGVVVYHETRAAAYGIGNNINGEHSGEVPAIPAIKIGSDVTGGGQPDAIVWSSSGGAHCCFKFRVLQLGNEFRVVAEINAEHSDRAHFVDLRHDGHYEFVGRDWAFAYWHASFAQSPAPEIVLRPEALHVFRQSPASIYLYGLALDLMQRPVPTATEFQSLVRELSKASEWNENGVPPRLWGSMLDLIYTGHPDLAWKLLDESWPKNRPGKGGFVGAFCDQLGRSHYWDDLAPLLKDAPADCFK